VVVVVVSSHAATVKARTNRRTGASFLLTPLNLSENPVGVRNRGHTCCMRKNEVSTRFQGDTKVPVPIT
jgi:hypothetical protein